MLVDEQGSPRRWGEAGALLGIGAGLLDGVQALRGGEGAFPRALLALLLATTIYGAATSAALWLVARVAGEPAGDRSARSPREAVAAAAGKVGYFCAACLGVSAVGILSVAGFVDLFPSLGWKTDAIAAAIPGVATLALGFAALRPHAARRPWRVSAAIAIVAALALWGALHAWRAQLLARVERPPAADATDPATPAQGARPNVLMVVLDTTRADHLSLYGYRRPTTPFLDRLAAESTTYDDAVATAPWTVPSHASMFTGLYPSAHHATCEHRTLDADKTTLAEILRRHGYATLGLSSNSWVGPDFGLDRGFESFFSIWRMSDLLAADPVDHLAAGPFLRPILERSRAPDKGAATVNAVAKRWLDGWQSADRRPPFFVFVNYLETHLPYAPPDAYRGRFGGAADAPRVSRLMGRDWIWQVFRRMAEPGSLTPEERQQLVDLYDAEVRYQDDRLAELVADVERRGLLDDTLLIVVGDHGENLGEHGGLLDHCFSLHQTVLHVPLVVRYPPRFEKGSRRPEAVTLASLFPTVLETVGVAAGAPRIGDAPPLPRKGSPPGAGIVFSEYDLPILELSMLATEIPGADVSAYSVRQRAAQNGDWKVLWRSDTGPRLYDLRRDPDEERGTDPGSRPEGSPLVEALESWARTLRALPAPSKDAARPLSHDAGDALRSLGYIR